MHLVLIAVISLDGRITRPEEPGPGFASPEDQAWFRRSLRAFDCSILGRATFDTLEGAAVASGGEGRLRMVVTRDPARHAARESPGAVEFSGAPAGALLAGLRSRGFTRCALLGGGQIYGMFLEAGLVDALWLTLEPVILGGGTPLVDRVVGHGRFALRETRALSADTLLLHYGRPGREGVPLPPP